MAAASTRPSERCAHTGRGWGLWGPWAHREPAWCCRAAPALVQADVVMCCRGVTEIFEAGSMDVIS